MESWSDALGTVLEAPGARYACVADPATGAILAAHDGPAAPAGAPTGPGIPDGPAVAQDPGTARDPAPRGPGTPGPPSGGPGEDAVAPDPVAATAAVLDWARTENARAGFEDAMITTGRAHHLVRALHRDDGYVLVYLLLDRARGNLALARRALVALRPGAGGARPVGALPGAPSGLPLRRGCPWGHAPVAPAADPAEPPAPPAVPARVAVPRQAPPPAAEQDPPVPVPLPRRAGGAPPASTAPPAREPVTPPADAPAVSPATPPGGRWADDVGTMARILAGLRRMDVSRTTES